MSEPSPQAAALVESSKALRCFQGIAGSTDETARFFAKVFQWAMLPTLSLLFYFVHGYAADGFMDMAANLDGRTERAGMLLGAFAAAMLGALVFAYPLARIYPRQAVAAAILVALPSIKLTVQMLSASSGRSFVVAMHVTAILSLVLLVPLAAYGVRRYLQRGEARRATR